MFATIQAAAYELIPAEERAGLKSLICRILMENLDQDAIDEALFNIMSLRNCEAPSSDKERYALAKLNLRAGLKVRGVLKANETFGYTYSNAFLRNL